MEQRPLGNSGLSVSPIALGTWAMGGESGIWGPADDNESIEAIHLAIESGVNLIDTSPSDGWGHSEELVGKAIAGKRDQVLIATKCGLLPPDGNERLPIRCLKPDSITKECEASLRRLRTDVIDLYQCHWPDPETPIDETMGALTKLQEHGKIRAIGLSNHGTQRVASAAEQGPIHCTQPEFSLINRRAADDLVPYCIEHNIAVLAYGPLAKGLLTGRHDEKSVFDGIRSTDPEFTGDRYIRNLSLVSQLSELAARNDKSVAQLAINWVIHQPGITAAIVGARRPSQVQENLGGQGWKLTDDSTDAIARILKGMDGGTQ